MLSTGERTGVGDYEAIIEKVRGEVLLPKGSK
jgi:hypothetical protein